MKATVYIFGNFADGYSQYPDNYTRDLFAKISKARKGATELVYHRENSLTYYIYTREISRVANTFIGLCYVFNDILITDFSYLFDIFEDTITNIVVKGELLEFTNEGNLTTKVNQLYSNTEELQRVADYLNSKLTTLGKYAEKLPPANYAISNTEWKSYSIDNIAEVKSVLKDYSNIRVIKGENYDTEALKGYAQKLKTQNTQIKTLTKEISNQKDEIAKLKRQKKQIKWVIFLLILIIIGGIGFYFYAQDKLQIIQDKSDTIYNLNNQIQKQENHITNLQNDSSRLSNALYQKTYQFNTVKQKLSNINYELNNKVSPYMYFCSWKSTNYHQQSSVSSTTYSFYAYADDELNIPYYVSSESGCDYLTIMLKRNGYSAQQLLKESGVKSGTCTHTFYASDSYQLTVSYSKDGSVDNNYDYAGVNQFYIYRSIVNRLREMSEYDN